MSRPTPITLAKALKVKNRLAGRLAKVQMEIQQFNSVLEGSDRPPVEKLAQERERLVALLIALKAAISRANTEIQPLIFELAECKAGIEFFQRLNTRHGPQGMYPGTDKPMVLTAVVRKEEVDARVAALERRIDDLQDRLDQHNQATRIDLDPQVLEAVGMETPPEPLVR
jgi:hypothetical protein